MASNGLKRHANKEKKKRVVSLGIARKAGLCAGAAYQSDDAKELFTPAAQGIANIILQACMTHAMIMKRITLQPEDLRAAFESMGKPILSTRSITRTHKRPKEAVAKPKKPRDVAAESAE